jgi:AcrR family transcriptional regulator
MPMKNRTRNMFADTLAAMLTEMPLEKVRITELCRRCGATPPTFYYYFKDKYELMAWIFHQDFSTAYGSGTHGYSPATISKALRIMAERKVFYQRAYSEVSQNSINKYIQAFNLKLSVEALQQEDPDLVITEDMLLAIRYHSYGVMGLFQEWIFGGISTSAQDLAAFQYDRTPEFLKKAFQARDWADQ